MFKEDTVKDGRLIVVFSFNYLFFVSVKMSAISVANSIIIIIDRIS